jgi:hypothetical protein
LWVLQNRALRRIFESKRGELTGVEKLASKGASALLFSEHYYDDLMKNDGMSM